MRKAFIAISLLACISQSSYATSSSCPRIETPAKCINHRWQIDDVNVGIEWHVSMHPLGNFTCDSDQQKLNMFSGAYDGFDTGTFCHYYYQLGPSSSDKLGIDLYSNQYRSDFSKNWTYIAHYGLICEKKNPEECSLEIRK